MKNSLKIVLVFVSVIFFGGSAWLALNGNKEDATGAAIIGGVVCVVAIGVSLFDRKGR